MRRRQVESELKKEGVSNKTAPTTLAKGPTEQHKHRRPVSRGGRRGCFCQIQVPKAQVGDSVGSKPDVRTSD